MSAERNIRQRSWAILAGGLGLIATGIGLMSHAATFTEAPGVAVSDIVTGEVYKPTLQDELGLVIGGVGLAMTVNSAAKLARSDQIEGSHE